MKCKVCDSECIPFIKKFQRSTFEYYKCLICKCVYKNFNVENPHSAPLKINEKQFLSKVSSYENSYLNEYIQKNYTKNTNILDIGCFDGALLYYLYKKMHITNDFLFGIDINSKSIEFSKKYVSNCSLSFFPEKDFVGKNKNKFSIIHSSENIYYLENPYKALSAMKEMLVDDGVIILKFTQNTSLFFKKFPIHIRVSDFNVMINIETLEYISEQLNLKIVKVSRFDNNYLLNYFGFSNIRTRPAKTRSFILKVLNKLINTIPFIPYKYSDKLVVVLKND